VTEPQPLSAEHLLDLIHESVVILGLDGRIASWNAASEALYGWRREEAIGRKADELFGESGKASDLSALDDKRGDTWRRTAAGERRLVELVRATRYDANGVAIDIVETGRDVTAARIAEEALRKSEHRYRNLFQAMAASFWELDFSPVGEMLYRLKKSGAVENFAKYFADHPEFVRDMMRATRVVDVNDQTVAIFGRGDKAELLQTVEPFWPEASTSVFAASVIAAITDRPNYATETRLRTIEGRQFPALFTACFPPDTMNKGTLLVGVIDISEQVAARTALAHMQSELAHASRVSMLGELAASIAHEVNQPLAAIGANGAAGLRWLSREEPDLGEIESLMTRVVADSRRAADIISRIRAMASGGVAQLATVSMKEIAEDTLVFLEHELQRKGVRLTLSVEPALPDLTADRIQLQQVLVNLAMNAIQAISGKADQEKHVAFKCKRTPDGIAVSVEDTGPGIAPDHLPRLFDSFFTTRSEGMGMGLAISRSIVEGLGGSISASNRPTGGACFLVTLPLQSET
jgi:PAS domain S-box-containing protein